MAEVIHVELPVTLIRCQRCESKVYELEVHLIGEDVVRYCCSCQIVYHTKKEAKP